MNGVCRCSGVSGLHSGVLQEFSDYLFISPEFQPTEQPEDKHPDKCQQHSLNNAVFEKITHIYPAVA